MFNTTTTTSFGATLTVLPTSLVCVPGILMRGPLDTLEAEAPLLQLRVPPPLLTAGTDRSGFVRLGCLQGLDTRIGVAMAYTAGHFAMAMYDHGEPEAKDMSRAMLVLRRSYLVLRAEDEFAVNTVRVTDAMHATVRECLEARPCTFAQFMSALADTARSLNDRETYAAMGIDAGALRSVTLSVCVTPNASPSHVEVALLNQTKQ